MKVFYAALKCSSLAEARDLAASLRARHDRSPGQDTWCVLSVPAEVLPSADGGQTPMAGLIERPAKLRRVK